ncbi:MAG TPA: hypothetical protein PKG95_14815 [Anaerolineaceae bacterium]|nr:hypothetical protein [Anaerolineaceae bacterium]
MSKYPGFRLMLLVFLLCLALAACNAAPTPITLTSTRLPATLQPRATPSPQFRHPPTYPPTPTSTPDIAAIQTRQTAAALATQRASFPATCEGSGNSSVMEPSFSPGGNWMAISCGYQHEQTLDIVNRDGQRWVLQFAELVQDHGGMGGLRPIHWTGDEVYLYFTAYKSYDGGGVCFYYPTVNGLYQINLDSGTVATILPETDVPGSYEVAISPNSRWIAYTNNLDQPRILDLRTGETVEIEVGKYRTGNLTWSPDGDYLAYARCEIDQAPLKVKNSGVQIFAIKTQTLATLLEVAGDWVVIESGEGRDFLTIRIENIETFSARYQFYDWSTGQMTTPTPAP